MNQGENTETVSSVEKNQITDRPLAVASWTTQGENHNLRENGAVSSSGYNHDQPPVATLETVQDGSNLASTVSTSTATQGYNGYAAYPNTEPNGYNNMGYAAYSNQYQEPNQYQQQTNQYQLQHNPYQQQHNPYQQQPNQYYQQPVTYQAETSQHQPETNQYQQQPNQSYPHHVGAYQNTGAPYQPLSSFQNTGSYTGHASYSSTYYNPGDYQTSGSYTTQTNLWQGGQYAAYGSHQYPNYSQDTNSAYSSAIATTQYEQQYKQWKDYYNQTQTEVNCAPGTENTSASVSATVNSLFPSGNTGYTSNNQVPAVYTPLWRAEASSSELTSTQSVAVSENTSGSYWSHGTPAFQNDPPNSLRTPAQKPKEVIPTYGSIKNQQSSTYSPVSTALYPGSYQASQSHQTSFQTIPQPPEPLDSHKTSKLQIPNNPRIASNLSASISKPNKDNYATAKPAYINVAGQKPNEKVVPQEEADPMLKPAVFPKSLRGYVERALARCKNDRQKAACQAIMREVYSND